MRIVKSKQGYHLVMSDGEKSWLEYILKAYDDSLMVSPNGEELDFIQDYFAAKFVQDYSSTEVEGK